MSQVDTYDYVIVGGGTAGCIVAARLAEDPGVTVCVLEAGTAEEQNPRVRVAADWASLIGSEFDWDYGIEPGRQSPTMRQSRARLLGGCSAHNSVICLRPHDADMVEWERLGAEGWGPEDTRPFFGKVFEKVNVEAAPKVNECALAFEQSALAAGFSQVRVNDEDFSSGYAWLTLNHRDGQRDSTADAYLFPMGELPPNLTVEEGVQVLGLLLNDSLEAVGVSTAQGEIRAEREVVLCAGVYETPKLLMLAGIGPADYLREFGIDVRLDLPGVGENLMDHMEGIIAWQATRPVPDTGIQNAENAVFWNSTGEGPTFDGMMPCITEPYYVDAKPAVGQISGRADFCMVPNNARVASRGVLRLRSGNPSDYPLIDHRYFTDPEDVDVRRIVGGLEMAREIVSQPGLRDWVEREVFPGPHVTSYGDLAEHARRNSNSVYHPAGTAKIGGDDDDLAVLDPQLRVRGVGRLRVADTSVYPDMPGVNICMTVMMVGERCADFIKQSAAPRSAEADSQLDSPL